MTTKHADNAAGENAKKTLEAEKKVSDKSRSEYARLSKGKPTPTQEELDFTACGGHILEHEADGSDPDPFVQPDSHQQTRHMEAKPAANYQTRSTRSTHNE